MRDELSELACEINLHGGGEGRGEGEIDVAITSWVILCHKSEVEILLSGSINALVPSSNDVLSVSLQIIISDNDLVCIEYLNVGGIERVDIILELTLEELRVEIEESEFSIETLCHDIPEDVNWFIGGDINGDTIIVSLSHGNSGSGITRGNCTLNTDGDVSFIKSKCI
jgi:hypothetical protein